MNNILLTKRLGTIAKYVNKGEIVADIGTDHGYIPIYLAQRGISQKIFAMDINLGPLEKAKKNIFDYGLEDKITTILSDGLLNFNGEQLDTIIIAGMGGCLINKILIQSKKLLLKVNKLILSPHLDADKVRKTVHRLGYKIIIEDIVEEDKKFYPIIVCEQGIEKYNNSIKYKYGNLKVQSNNNTLKKYLIKEKYKYEKILKNFLEKKIENSEDRKNEIIQNLNDIQEVIKCL